MHQIMKKVHILSGQDSTLKKSWQVSYQLLNLSIPFYGGGRYEFDIGTSFARNHGEGLQ